LPFAGHVSAIDFPVFVDGLNYGGSSPPNVGHPGLGALVRASLGARVGMVPDALVVPSERPLRSRWSSWRWRASWIAVGVCSGFPIRPGQTGIVPAYTPNRART
jgi:hypothetical protein